jgi:hypothetical protein
VSPYTSIIFTGPPFVALEANGQLVPPPALEAIGPGVTAAGPGDYWRVRSPLAPSTTYVLRAQEPAGTRELTRFTTAAGYDKQPATPPKLDGLRLWRVRYDAAQVNAGGCVFDEYEGYTDVDYQTGALPGTPPAEIVYVLALQPKNGADVQSFVFSGIPRFEGASVEAPSGNGSAGVPAGGRPSPALAPWKPVLSPDREYCATLTIYGRNDQAIEAARSNTVCAPVMNVDARSALAAPPAEGTGPPKNDGGGCSLSGRPAGAPPFALALLLPLLAAARRRRRRSRAAV